MTNPHWQTSRHIVERITITGTLELLTPAHFGGAEAGDTADMLLLCDTATGVALLPGASIAGALRNYWREYTQGYGAPSADTPLFGAQRGAQDAMEGHQSLLIVEDAFGPAPQIELRDGVQIDIATRTAAEDKLFDMEVLRAGTTFPLRFELLIPAGQRASLCRDLALALQGFERAEISLGARKRRGLGRCRVQAWHVWRYDLTQPAGLLAWLGEDRGWSDLAPTTEATGATLADKLGVVLDVPDQRNRFEVTATFALEDSLMVRSGQTGLGPDIEHLHRRAYCADDPEAGERTPVLPGTSLAGVLRAQATRILNTLASQSNKTEVFIKHLFGTSPEGDDKEHRASRLLVHESAVEPVKPLAQTRIRVDRFTGGAMDTYLFSEAPVFGGADSRMTLEWVLRDPAEYEIGLLLLLLKDLWTGFVPVGGESSVGRGRLKGIEATLTRVQAGKQTQWELKETPAGLAVGATPPPETGDASQTLETFVKLLTDELTQGGA